METKRGIKVICRDDGKVHFDVHGHKGECVSTIDNIVKSFEDLTEDVSEVVKYDDAFGQEDRVAEVMNQGT